MLISPVSIICNCLLHKETNERKHLFLSNASNKSINHLFTEIDIVFLLIFSSEAFLGSHPVCVNILIDIDHELENLIKDVFDQSVVFLGKAWLSFDHSGGKFQWLVTN